MAPPMRRGWPALCWSCIRSISGRAQPCRPALVGAAHGADVIVTYDADGQHQASDIAKLRCGAESHTRRISRSAIASWAARSI